jgi:uncharacterized protein YjbI with pentapeptide repeats
MQRKKLSVMAALPLFVAAVDGCDGTAGQIPDGIETTVAPVVADNGINLNGINLNGINLNGINLNGINLNGINLNGITINGINVNGIAINGIALNALFVNGISVNGILVNGITVNGIHVNGAPANVQEPAVQQVVTYLVSCALPEGDSITYTAAGTPYTFAGEIGLAPQWKNNACDEECQGWVSACLLSRINHQGEHVEISMRGKNDGLKLDRHEARDFGVREAAYYGNLFDGSGNAFACYSPGSPSIPRVCGDSLENCPMKVVGSCDQACRREGAHHTFQKCTGTPPVQKKNDLFDETITVFLRGK